MLAAVGALSSWLGAALIAVPASLAAIAALVLARRSLHVPAHAVTLAWYGASAALGLVLLLGTTNGLGYYSYIALLLLAWHEVTARVPQVEAGRTGPLAARRAIPLATAGVLLLGWMPFWLAYLPGIMSPDSLNEWSQAASMRLSDFSPAIYTLFIHFAGTLVRSPAGVSLVQLLLSSGLLASLYGYLDRRGAPRVVLLAGLGLYLGLPIFGTFTVTLWHDILYSLLVLWVTHAMYAMYLSQGDWLATRGRALALAGALSLIPLLAHNGISVVFGVLVAALIVLRRARRRLLAVAAGVLLGFLGVQLGLYPLLGVQPYSKAFASEAMIHQISAAIAQHGTSGLSRSETSYLSSIMPLRDWVRKYNPYTPQFLVSTRLNPAFDEEPIDRDYGKFLEVWADIGLRYPGSYLGERISENALVLRPTGSYRIALSSLDVASNSLGLKTRSAAQPLLDTLRRIAAFTIQNMLWLWRPFWAMWLLALLTIVGAFLRGRIALFTAIPWVFQVLGLAVSIQGQSVRYYYSLFLIIPYFAAVVLTRTAAGADRPAHARRRLLSTSRAVRELG